MTAASPLRSVPVDQRAEAAPAKPTSGGPSWRDRPLLSFSFAAELTGLSKAKLRDEANRGRLASVYVGRRRLIRTAALIAWLDALPEGAP